MHPISDSRTDLKLKPTQDSISAEIVQRELSEREVQLLLALNLSGTGICELDLASGKLTWDASVREIFGAIERSSTTEIKVPIAQLDPRDRRFVIQSLRNALIHNEPRFESEFRIHRLSDGAERWIRVTGQVLDRTNRKTPRMFFITRDITSEKTAAEQLKQSRWKINNLLNQIPQLIWTSTAAGKLIYANDLFLEFAGGLVEGKKLRNWLHSIHPQDAQEVIGKWNTSIVSGEDFEAEYRLRKPDGEFTWFLGRAVAVRDSANRISEWFGTATNIHDKKESERKRVTIQKKVLQLQNIATSLAYARNPLEVAQIVVDHGMEAIDASAGFVSLIGARSEPLPMVYARGHSESSVEKIGAMTLKSDAFAVQAIHSRAAVFEKGFAAFPLLVQGDAIGVIEFCYKDATMFNKERVGYLGILAEQCAQAIERARLFEAERKARRLAENAANAKSQFLANMSHEIRTPMNAILGFSDLLADRTLNETEREDYRRRIRMNGDQLMNLIDDVLDLSKVENGRLKIEKAAFSVTDLVRDILAKFEDVLQQKGLKTRVVTSANVPETIESDPTRLRQILANLIGNALKFTDHGRIETRISYNESPPNLIIEVEDTGIGISKELHQRLFKPFAQGDSSVTRRFGGSGLGLVVSRGMADLLGGNLELVKSESSRGSVFRLTLPMPLNSQDPQIDMFAPPPIQVDSSLKESRLDGIRVLLVEDSFDNEMLIRAYLKGTGVHLEVAHNGAEAIDRATDRVFDVVLMDIQMPVMDGLQATRLLKSQNYEVPIVALSAHALPEEVERSLAAGCRSHLTKPIVRQVLIDQIRTFAAATGT